MLILELPPEVLEKILNCLSYDEVSHCRLVCRRFNEISKIALNRGFSNVQKLNMHCLKSVRAQLPRRSSERYRHSLQGHYLIFNQIQCSLNSFSLTYKRYIDSNKCCFIPGKVLDEIFRVIRYVNSVQQTPIDLLDAHDMLEEMRDLSLMAREHFTENIAPGLDKKQEEMTHFRSGQPTVFIAVAGRSNGMGPVTSGNSAYPVHNFPPFTADWGREDTWSSLRLPSASVLKPLRPNAPPSQTSNLPSVVKELSKKYDSVMSELTSFKIKKKELSRVEKRITDLEQSAADCKKKIGETEKTIAEQRAVIYRQDMKLFDQELQIEKLTKLVEEMQEVGNVVTACKNSTAGTRRGRNGGRETAIVTKASKRKLRQNLSSDPTSTRGRKKSRRS